MEVEMPKNKPATSPRHVRLPLKWHVPDDIVSRFATNLVVQTLEDAFKLSFFEAKPEIRLQKTAAIPRDVRADCVACIIISPEKLPSIIQVLQRQLDSFNESKKQPQAKP